MSQQLWQQPFVNVFRHLKQTDWKRVKIQGDVVNSMDKDAKGSIWSINGAIPAANYMFMPKSGSLNLIGKYFYITYKPVADKYFVFHIDVTTPDCLVVRISLSNMFKVSKATSTWIQLPVISSSTVNGKPTFKTRWTILCLDLSNLLSNYVHRTFSSTKSIKICANVAVKSIGTSNTLYEADKLPRDLGLQPPTGVKWHDIFDFIKFPDDNNFLTSYPSKGSSKLVEEISDFSSISNKRPIIKELPEVNVNILSDDLAKHVHVSKSNGKKFADVEENVEEIGNGLKPDPILRLKSVVGLNPLLLTWNLRSDEIVYSAHAIIIALNVDRREQRFFVGHTGKVTCLSSARGLLVSADSNGLARLWDLDKGKCLSVIQAPGCRLLDISSDAKIVCGIGRDSYGKTLAMIWETSQAKSGKVQCLVKAHTDVDITAIKIVSHLSNIVRFASCGKQNLRIWRIKESSLRSAPIVLPVSDLDLTDVAVSTDRRRVYACASSGHVLEVDFERMSVVQARRLVASGGNGLELNSISISDSMCATASNDGILRQWPHDFAKVLLEADLENEAVKTLFSPDGLRVAAATKSSSLGVLDIATRSFTTLCRGHASNIKDLSKVGRQIVSIGEDRTIRIWDDIQQLYDFTAPQDAPLKVSGSVREPYLAVGFKSGAVRILDIPRTCILHESRSSKKPISGIAYGLLHIYASDVDGTLTLYECNGLRIVRQLPFVTKQTDSIDLALSSDYTKLAVPAITKGTLNILEASSLDELIRCDVGGDINCISFHPNQQYVLAGCCSKIVRICSQTGRILSSLDEAHRKSVTSVSCCLSPHVLSGGDDDVLKVWGYEKVWRRRDAKFQVFIGHGSTVNKLILSDDQLTIASCSSSAILFWDFNAPLPTISDFLRPEVEEIAVRDEPQDDVNSDDIDKLSEIARDPENLAGQDIESDQNEELIETIKPESLENRLSSSLIQPAMIIEQREPSPQREYAQPSTKRHFRQRRKDGSLAHRRYLPSEESAGIKMSYTIGFDGEGRNNLAWSSESGLMVYSSGCVVIVDELGGDKQFYLCGHMEQISTIELSNDSSQIASSSRGQIFIWNVDSKKKRTELRDLESEIVAMKYSNDDRFLAAIGDYTDRRLIVFTTDRYEIYASATSQLIMHDVSWPKAYTGQLLTTAENGLLLFWTIDDSDKTLKVEETRAPRELFDSDLTCVVDSESIYYVGTSKGSVSAWDVKRGNCVLHWTASERDEILCLACSNSPKKVVSGGKTLRLWSTEEALSPKGDANVTLLSEMTLDGIITSMTWNETLEMGLVGTSGNTLWYVNWLDQNSVRLVGGHPKYVTDLIVRDDCVATCCQDGSVRVWTSKELTLQFDVKAKNVSATKMAWERNFLVVGYSDGTIRIFDLQLVKMLSKIVPHSKDVTAIAIMSNIVLSGSTDGIIAATSLSTALTVRVLKAHSGSPITGIQVLGTRWLATSEDSRISVWKADWCQDRCELEDWITLPRISVNKEKKGKTLACFSQDEPDCVVIFDEKISANELSIYNLTAQRIVRTLPIVHDLVCFDVGGSLIGLGSRDRLLTLMDYFEGSFQDFSPYDDSITVIKFDPSGKRLVTASFCSITVWDVVHS
ncbi:DgyrCDS12585 [Dimorphilus gyrociliatus]|uniref:DgyrCDS12585 n=1 Tax=Dimorphilus gyrociliatus TaxID=2664684 RepID=A0A7I8W6X4_9ANNE|nr:DgyrCDS12585 [Dimorphilus gyrociliatus]